VQLDLLHRSLVIPPTSCYAQCISLDSVTYSLGTFSTPRDHPIKPGSLHQCLWLPSAYFVAIAYGYELTATHRPSIKRGSRPPIERMSPEYAKEKHANSAPCRCQLCRNGRHSMLSKAGGRVKTSGEQEPFTKFRITTSYHSDEYLLCRRTSYYLYFGRRGSQGLPLAHSKDDGRGRLADFRPPHSSAGKPYYTRKSAIEVVITLHLCTELAGTIFGHKPYKAFVGCRCASPRCTRH
jgi:hypothetical protein